MGRSRWEAYASEGSQASREFRVRIQHSLHDAIQVLSNLATLVLSFKAVVNHTAKHIPDGVRSNVYREIMLLCPFSRSVEFQLTCAWYNFNANEDPLIRLLYWKEKLSDGD